MCIKLYNCYLEKTNISNLEKTNKFSKKTYRQRYYKENCKKKTFISYNYSKLQNMVNKKGPKKVFS